MGPRGANPSFVLILYVFSLFWKVPKSVKCRYLYTREEVTRVHHKIIGVHVYVSDRNLCLPLSPTRLVVGDDPYITTGRT